jgi:hypothetical protein
MLQRRRLLQIRSKQAFEIITYFYILRPMKYMLVGDDFLFLGPSQGENQSKKWYL